MRRQALLAPLVLLFSSSLGMADCSALSFVTILDGNFTAAVIPIAGARDYFLEGRNICSTCVETAETTAGYDALGNLYAYGRAGGFPISLWRTSPQGARSELLRILPEDRGLGCALLETPGVATNNVDGWVDIPFQGGFSEGNPVLLRVSGLPRLLDVFASYTPTTQVAVSASRFPDGLLQPLDARDLLSGDVATLPDFSRATRACAAVPLPTDSVPILITDPLPEPDLGHSLYFLVASRGVSETRMGRSFSNGQFQGRSVSGLPSCSGGK